MVTAGATVIKVGGELVDRVDELGGALAAALARCGSEASPAVVIHGGGTQASELAERLGLVTERVAGRRVTDEATLRVVKMALAGSVSVDLAASLLKNGVRAVCTTGVSAGLVMARRLTTVIEGGVPRQVDLGWVGEVESVDVQALRKLWAGGFVPVLSSLAGDAAGNVYNVNADTMAAGIAVALQAHRILMVSNVPGVLAHVGDPTSLYSRLDARQAQALIERGVIRDGMAVKVEEALRLIGSGAKEVRILDLAALESWSTRSPIPQSSGTALVPAESA